MVGMNIRSRTLSSAFQDDANQLPYMMWNSWMGESQQRSSRSVLLQVSLLTLELWITNYFVLYGITYLWKCHYRVGLLGVKYATLPQRTVWSWRRSWLETMWSFNNIVRKGAEYRFSKPKSLQVLTESLEDVIGDIEQGQQWLLFKNEITDVVGFNSSQKFMSHWDNFEAFQKKRTVALKSSGQDARRAGAEREEAKEEREESSPRSPGLTAWWLQIEWVFNCSWT